MELTDKERLIKLETLLPKMDESLKRIENTLVHHANWEEKKYDEMEAKFAGKGYEQFVKDVNNKVDEMPEKLTARFAGIWVETWVKAVAFASVASIIIIIIQFFLQNHSS